MILINLVRIPLAEIAIYVAKSSRILADSRPDLRENPSCERK